MLRRTKPAMNAATKAVALRTRPMSSTAGKVRSTLALAQLSQSQSRPQLQLQLRSYPPNQQSQALVVQSSFRAPYSTKPPAQPSSIDTKAEKEAASKKLGSDPAHVSTESSVRHVFEESQGAAKGERDVSDGVQQDLRTVKETFALNSVPRESYALGLAGTLPYFGTSLATVYLAWDIRTGWPTDSNFLNSFMVSEDTARHLLTLLEPIQLGYGAIIISFLGAIHWGLEYAEKVPLRERTRFRYGMGLAASVIAWPSLLLPVDFALISQFAAFVGLYFADARATAKGWAPAWYGTYRFVLTAIVGAAIFISLVGRARVSNESARLSTASLQETMKGRADIAQPYDKWAKQEEEEKEKIKKEKEEEEERKKKAEEKEKKTKKGKGKKGEEGGKGGDGKKKEEEEPKDDSKKKSDDKSQKDENDANDDSEDESKDDAKETKGKDVKSDDQGKNSAENDGAKDEGNSNEKGDDKKGDDKKGDDKKSNDKK